MFTGTFDGSDYFKSTKEIEQSPRMGVWGLCDLFLSHFREHVIFGFWAYNQRGGG